MNNREKAYRKVSEELTDTEANWICFAQDSVFEDFSKDRIIIVISWENSIRFFNFVACGTRFIYSGEESKTYEELKMSAYLTKKTLKHLT